MDSPLLYGISLFLVDTPWYVMACVPFMEQARLKTRSIVLLGVGMGLLKAVASGLLVAFAANWRDYTFAVYVVHSALLLAFYLLCFRVQPSKLAYTLLLLQAIATTVNLCAGAVVAEIFPGEQISIAHTPLYTAAVVAGIALAYPFVWRFFSGRLRSAFRELSTKNIWLLCLTPVLFLFLYQIFMTEIQKTAVPTSSVSLLTLLILATGLITYYVTLRMLMDNARHVRQESEAETRLALQAQNYENLTQSIETARAARHDLRHHVGVLRDFAAQGDTEGMTAYLEEYAASLPVDDTPDWCENRTVNALLKHYLAQAEQAGVALDVRLDLPLRPGVPDTDLCVVFGNIFENAVASAVASAVADGSNPYVRARCETVDESIVLTVENSRSDEAAPSHGEGYGLKNVEAAAKKHGGTVRFEAKGAVYCSRVLLPIKPRTA